MNTLEELEKAVSALRLCKSVKDMFVVNDNIKMLLGRLCYNDIEKARATASNSQSAQCLCKKGKDMYVSSGWCFCPYCGGKL